MFEAFYGSFWQHPLLLWLAPLAFLLHLARRGALPRAESPLLLRYVWLFGLGTLLDPLATGPVVSALGLGATATTAVNVLFVLLGDLRYFVLVETASRAEPEAKAPRVRWASAAALTLVVPLAQLGLAALRPEWFTVARHTFVAYELLFLAFSAAYFFGVVAPRPALRHPETARWLRAVALYALGYYLLWPLADAVILAGHDAGFALRVVPNVLYYGFFLPFVWWRAPRALREGARKGIGGHL